MMLIVHLALCRGVDASGISCVVHLFSLSFVVFKHCSLHCLTVRARVLELIMNVHAMVTQTYACSIRIQACGFGAMHTTSYCSWYWSWYRYPYPHNLECTHPHRYWINAQLVEGLFWAIASTSHRLINLLCLANTKKISIFPPWNCFFL